MTAIESVTSTGTSTEPVDVTTATSSEPSAPLLEVREITKRFGTLLANNGVSFSVRAGQVHALLGDVEEALRSLQTHVGESMEVVERRAARAIMQMALQRSAS